MQIQDERSAHASANDSQGSKRRKTEDGGAQILSARHAMGALTADGD